jgi:hypothetical protein
MVYFDSCQPRPRPHRRPQRGIGRVAATSQVERRRLRTDVEPRRMKDWRSRGHGAVAHASAAPDWARMPPPSSRAQNATSTTLVR